MSSKPNLCKHSPTTDTNSSSEKAPLEIEVNKNKNVHKYLQNYLGFNTTIHYSILQSLKKTNWPLKVEELKNR